MRIQMLKIERGPDFAKRLGDLLKTRAQFTIVLLPSELAKYYSTSSLDPDSKTEIICREFRGMVVESDESKMKKIKNISPDEWRSCVGPQNEEVFLHMLRGVTGNILLDRNSRVVLMNFEATPEKVFRLA